MTSSPAGTAWLKATDVAGAGPAFETVHAAVTVVPTVARSGEIDGGVTWTSADFAGGGAPTAADAGNAAVNAIAALTMHIRRRSTQASSRV